LLPSSGGSSGTRGHQALLLQQFRLCLAAFDQSGKDSATSPRPLHDFDHSPVPVLRVNPLAKRGGSVTSSPKVEHEGSDRRQSLWVRCEDGRSLQGIGHVSRNLTGKDGVCHFLRDGRQVEARDYNSPSEGRIACGADVGGDEPVGQPLVASLKSLDERDCEL